MDRRAILATLTGKGASAGKTAPATSLPLFPRPMTATAGLEPYTGPWEYEQAAHLLRRTTFGPTYEMTKQAVSLGLEGTLAELLKERPFPDPPINYYYDGDPSVPIGETWVDAPYHEGLPLRTHRRRSLFAWTILQMYEEKISLREKLTLFWINHFGVSGIIDPKFLFNYTSKLLGQPWGNFRDLIKTITIDPTMLRFLNGNQNLKNAPNENYARELLELFTIGKGPAAGPGDYTNYTEEDIREMARVLTGWQDRGFDTRDQGQAVESFFDPEYHDTGAKRLSHRFNNVVITDMGDQEYAHLIDIIFQQEEVARYLCRKFYRWFVDYVIDDYIEENVIQPMAQTFIDNDYEVRPVIEMLLRSAHFFDFLKFGPMIKNPLDFTVSVIKQTRAEWPEDVNHQYALAHLLYHIAGGMEMWYFDVPEVAGWKAFYQSPQYYRTWISATTLQKRMSYASEMTDNGIFEMDFRAKIRPLKFIETLDNRMNPNSLILEIAKIFYPVPLTELQLTKLKEVLLPGLPDYEWTVEYGEYLADPGNQGLAEALTYRLAQLMRVMLNLAEFHLS